MTRQALAALKNNPVAVIVGCMLIVATLYHFGLPLWLVKFGEISLCVVALIWGQVLKGKEHA